VWVVSAFGLLAPGALLASRATRRLRPSIRPCRPARAPRTTLDSQVHTLAPCKKPLRHRRLPRLLFYIFFDIACGAHWCQVRIPRTYDNRTYSTRVEFAAPRVQNGVRHTSPRALPRILPGSDSPPVGQGQGARSTPTWQIIILHRLVLFLLFSSLQHSVRESASDWNVDDSTTSRSGQRSIHQTLPPRARKSTQRWFGRRICRGRLAFSTRPSSSSFQ
ncbi:hypothetical protein C8J57DRAFT_1710826, partial [Mycena rebaudengoi]